MTDDNKKILLSGIKPTGKSHIGNYFGAIRQWIDMQDEYKCYIMIADLHAITTAQDAKTLKQDTLDMAIDYLATGIDPNKVVLFKQSDIAEHTELGWIFNCITTMPYLARAHAFKDAEAKNREINVGLFDYPLLMAADILLYETDVVPVGKDQQQHVEIARDTAEKFNRIYGDTFKLPEHLILDDVAVTPGTDGQKMSKSYKNTIPLFADEQDLRAAVMSIVTDSKGVEESKNPEEDNVFALHKLFTPADQLADIKKRYVEGGIGYRESKDILFANMNAFIEPLRKRRAEIAANPNQVIEILRNGAQIARDQAKLKMTDVRAKVGTDL